MGPAALERMQRELDAEVRRRFPDAPIQGVAILPYGDEPGELLARIVTRCRSC
jgi:hypothetical protein